MATGPRGEVVGFSVPSSLVTDNDGVQLSQWSTLGNMMNGFFQNEATTRIWIRDIHVDLAHGNGSGANGLHAYILYENAWLPFEETRIGCQYEARFFEGPLPSEFDTWEEWFANEIDDNRGLFIPKHIVPVPPVTASIDRQDTRYFTVGFRLTPAEEIGQRRFDTTCFIGIPIEDIDTSTSGNNFGTADLYDSTGKFVWQPNSIVNADPTNILRAGEICLVIPDQEDSDYIAIPMCCRGP